MGVLSKIKTNNSTFFSKTACEDGHKWWVSFEFYPFAIGENMTVFEGRMYNKHGYWSQSKSAVKTLNNAVGTEDNLTATVVCSERARWFANSFHGEYPGLKKINFVMPCLAEMDSISVFNAPFRYLKGYEKQLAEHEYVLIQELLEGDFNTYINAEGAQETHSDILDTFLHYTYVESNGDMVVTNLEGVQRTNDFKLSNVIIHSRRQTFGQRDQGEAGILNVFKNHKCNGICKNWPKPTVGLVPTAPAYSENKLDLARVVGTDLLDQFGSKNNISPPPYELVNKVQTSSMTNDRPLVHGNS